MRERWPTERVFTYWDYRAGMFHQDLGMRIDLVLASAPVAERVRAAWVDRQARKGSGPSDHAPVIVDLDEAPDGDIGPVVPPPSAPARQARRVKLPQSPVTRKRGPLAHPRAVAVPRGLHPLRLARHLRIVRRVGHVARPSAASRSDMSSSGCSEWAASSIAAWRSPISANRAGIVATVKSSGATSASSSQRQRRGDRRAGFGRTL